MRRTPFHGMMLGSFLAWRASFTSVPDRRVHMADRSAPHTAGVSSIETGLKRLMRRCRVPACDCEDYIQEAQLDLLKAHPTGCPTNRERWPGFTPSPATRAGTSIALARDIGFTNLITRLHAS